MGRSRWVSLLRNAFVLTATVLVAVSCSKNEAPGTETVPPGRVSDLQIAVVFATSVRLTWTAPGDDGDQGTAQIYDVRYSQAPITSSNWASRTHAQGEPSPQAAGSAEVFTVTGLSPSTHYYVALRAYDDAGNPSDISNGVEASTPRLFRRLVVDRTGGGDFLTIGEAIAAAAENDTVYIQPGLYEESLSVQGKTFVLMGHDADATIVQADTSTGSRSVLQITQSSDMQVRSLRFVQPFISCGTGVVVDESRLVMEDCVLARCGLTATSTDLTLRRCTVWRVPPMMCDMLVPMVGLIDGTAVIEQSIIGGAYWGISCAAGTPQPAFSCNDLWLNTSGNYIGCQDPTGTGGNISQDPRFVNFTEENFHLREDSPCLEGATPGCGRMGVFD